MLGKRGVRFIRNPNYRYQVSAFNVLRSGSGWSHHEQWYRSSMGALRQERSAAATESAAKSAAIAAASESPAIAAAKSASKSAATAAADDIHTRVVCEDL